MIIGIGIDVCDVERFAESVRRTPRMVDRLFTAAEAERPVASQAARFAAKEALAKALGAPAGLSWHDAEVVTDERGRPEFKVTGTVAASNGSSAARTSSAPYRPITAGPRRRSSPPARGPRRRPPPRRCRRRG